MEKDSSIKKSRAIRRLVIWYKRNSAVTSIVDTAANSAVTASNVAGNVVSGAGSVVSTASNVAGNVAGNVVSSAESVVNTASNVVSSASSIAKNTLQPLVFDPLKRLQNSDNLISKEEVPNSERIWIAVDGMGGDYAPVPILEGCLGAISRFPINIKFVGKIEKVRYEAERVGLIDLLEKEIDNNRLELIDSGDPIGMNEEATAVRKRKDASINVAMDLVKTNKAKAVYSAGNSGALMASAIFRIGRLKGIERPAIGALFPTRDQTRPVLVLDVGANTDCKPSYLHQFALLGNVYAKDVLQIEKPRIGLLNIGEEECKGNDLSIKTFELLSNEKSFNFGGNCEGRDVLSGDFDVVVCDGFTGNILLKFLESVGGVLLDILRSELPRGRRGKVGSAFLKSNLLRIKKRLDHAEHGGALLLGVNGICVIGHGSSKSLSVVSALRLAHSAVNHNVMENLNQLQKLQVLNS
ncbi:fatty acid/phospholipid synthesis protein PlsX [Prochlorococcus marinus subsp. pastoris str. CCMP1986]|uniref:Phosphate acyltransferase n=1 Tax=Prochlorococcus marinus subsp. pastoris (strain CCMP1986 / NIES-2087 / MED4) TaxID=59919 RepID=PLSX_PROMP|nr:phosphate acyltransferase PlsX [Prochlorococcus marinus]Q7V3E1.1 RecName: Full=Phosphate acyltransferase; AltName: Full=Acyl-ACP phosphotransacylase; AltName: Full=Acyl-[acyl-carrier-protein]--phosphate acyltransferase; AltName: Full=Phosphate-acyl-ACP acyltransferase [Prochlorococcus marinus subsp. pastoris str. CCMP1986]KGF88113.1 Phosphate:acyl-ACP acyltransferase PlsX [Prochlorococcus marinus str. EQPAC1]CAE18594.1 fatty acid/phospholipid synthesis protein PlsX [Prochlorococcus marinus su